VRIDYGQSKSSDNPDDGLQRSYALVRVADQGAGMDAETLAHIYDPFFTTKAPGEGTGLGLSMVYGFLRQSHGHIKIYSEPGVGTTVRLYLPRAEAGAEPQAAAETPSAPAAGGGERILVVEDNPDVRRVVLTQLEGLGYQTIEAEHAEAALDLLKQGTAVDLLFTDIVMPGRMNGIDLARTARTLKPGLKVLLTSGFAKAAIDGGAPPADFKELLSKPYRRAELAEKLRSVLDSEE
jgi:CheY-like chemotaxis protein